MFVAREDLDRPLRMFFRFLDNSVFEASPSPQEKGKSRIKYSLGTLSQRLCPHRVCAPQ